MHFVTLVNFTPQGRANVGGSPQRAYQFIETVKNMGVNIRELWWTQGEMDGIILFDAPDAETAAAAMLKATAEGNVTTNTMVAFDAEMMMNILSKATG